MKLSDYLKKYSLTHKAFAKMTGVSQAHITNILSGRKNASASLMKEIEDTTNREVTIYELFNPSKPSKVKKNRTRRKNENARKE